MSPRSLQMSSKHVLNAMLQGKIKTEDEALRWAERLRRGGKTIVAVSGAFDIVHAGHVLFLERARQEGDALLVFLNSDASVRLRKGDTRPLLSGEKRARVLSAFEDVDTIVIFNDPDPRRLLVRIKPNVYCNGSDWGKDCIERDTVESYGGYVYIIERTEDSTTSIIEKIASKFK